MGVRRIAERPLPFVVSAKDFYANDSWISKVFPSPALRMNNHPMAEG